MFELDRVGADRLDAAESHDVFDAPQTLEFGDSQRCSVVHGRRDTRIETEQLATSFKPREQIVDAFGLGRRLNGARYTVDRVGHKFERLHLGAVPHPRVAGPYPPDYVRVDSVVEEPSARIGACLAAADDRVAGRRLTYVGQLVHGNAPDIRIDQERRRLPRRDRWFEITGVDDGTSDMDLRRRPRKRRR